MAGHTLRQLETNGIRVRIAEQGEGPLVLLLHGFPESWYSWRHQLPALAEAGFHAVAPDLRGYGASDAPEAVEDYDIVHLTADAAGIVDALGEETAVVVGHDWGAIVAWQCALLRPDRFRAVAALSVPYGGRAPMSPLAAMRMRFGENFFYGRERPRRSSTPRRGRSCVASSARRGAAGRGGAEVAEPPTITDPLASAGGWIGRMPEPKALPAWLSERDLDHYVGEFERAGFRGGINFYRNFERNWEITPQLDGAKMQQPALFIAGAQDAVITRRLIEGGRPAADGECRRRHGRSLATRVGCGPARLRAHPRYRSLDAAGAPGRGELGADRLPSQPGLNAARGARGLPRPQSSGDTC